MRLKTVLSIVESHRKGVVTPPETVRRCYEHIRALGDPGIFITLRDQDEA
jgi:allophanate hydrolase